MSKAYPSNLTLAQYEFISDHYRSAKPGGRTPRSGYVVCPECDFIHFGRRSEMAIAEKEIFQVGDCYTYFRNWRRDGTGLKIHEWAREWVRIEHQRHPSP